MRVIFWALYSIILILELNASRIKFNSDVITDLPSIISSGKRQLETIELKARVPLYGECWADAVSKLEVGCRSLNADIQSSLAFRLTDCFLQTSGHEPILCEVSRRDCLQSLSDRAFNAYTEFYTHTQSICYFLQSKLWHEETEKTIDKLAFTSLKVTSQLAEAEKGQAALLKQQKESLSLQESLAHDLNNSKETISILMNDLRAATEEQKSGLAALFQQVSALQTWVIGEVSWIDSIFFYSSASLLAFLFTSTPRTKTARLLLFCLLAVNYVFERSLCSEKSEDAISPIFQVTEDIKEWIWLSRKVLVVVCAAVVLTCFLTYKDYNFLNHELLVQIKKQNEEIKLWLRELSNEQTCNYPLLPDIPVHSSAIPLPYTNLIAYGRSAMTGKTKFTKESSPMVVESAGLLEPRQSFSTKTRNSIDIESLPSSETSSEISERSLRRSLRIKR